MIYNNRKVCDSYHRKTPGRGFKQLFHTYPHPLFENQIFLLKEVQSALQPALSALKKPFCLEALSLVGEDDNGRFHEISRFGLSG